MFFSSISGCVNKNSSKSRLNMDAKIPQQSTPCVRALTAVGNKKTHHLGVLQQKP